MPRYLIRFGLDAPIELKKALTFRYQGHEVKLVPGDAPYDLEVETDCEASDFRKAQGMAADTVVRPVIDAVAFHRKTRITLWDVTRMLKAEPGQLMRRLILVDTRKQSSPVKLNETWVKPIQELLDAAGPDLARPLRWLRNAYGSRSPLEEFIYTWLALENMAGEKVVRKKCHECGRAADPYKAPDRKKAYQIVSSSDPSIDGKTFHKQWWDALRNTVFHGKEQPDSKLLNEVTKVLDHLQSAVERYMDHELGVTFRRRTNSASEVTLFGSWNYLEFQTAEPAAEFAPDPPAIAMLNAIVDERGVSSAQQETNTRWLSPAEFDEW
jgi:hypothetical protein